MSKHKLPPPPLFTESIGSALIDAARISTVAALTLLPPDPPPPKLVLPVRPGTLNARECLAQALQWLDAARQQTIEQSTTPPTSLHVIAGARTS